ncbi:MAG: hypothetical protein IPP34_19385 [Bacteroidetes bacterium]|nr:hypothetical protein [Bacteroidota bacterium]
MVNTPPLATDFKFVSNSVGYGNFGEIEFARNSLMYASSSQPLTIGAFNPSVLNPTIINFSSFGFPNPPVANWQSTNFYTFTDQIDGQNYSRMLQTPITLY